MACEADCRPSVTISVSAALKLVFNLASINAVFGLNRKAGVTECFHSTSNLIDTFYSCASAVGVSVIVMWVVTWPSCDCVISPPAPGATHTHADTELPLVEMMEDAEPDLPGQHV